MTAEPSPAPQGKFEPLTGVRIFFAAVGILIMVFAGGCALLHFFADPGSVILVLVLVFGGLPFLLGYGIWRAAVSAGRRRIQ